MATLETEPTLDVGDVDPDPFVQLQRWLDEELDAGTDPVAALAAALATATPDGTPSVRFVLLRDVSADGLRFYTNRQSQKGRELAANPRASIALYWPRLGRQVRADGSAEPLSDAESAAYFATRPAGSRYAAWVSPQSTVVPDREVLERRFEETAARFATEDVPLPPWWGGYRLLPDTVELWQNRTNRLHDRIRYRRSPDDTDADTDAAADAWIIERLAP